MEKYRSPCEYVREGCDLVLKGDHHEDQRTDSLVKRKRRESIIEVAALALGLIMCVSLIRP